MPSLEMQKRLWAVGVFIMPVIVLKLCTVLLVGSSPQGAEASTLGAAPISLPLAASSEVKWTSRQLEAAKHIQALRKEPFGPTPMYYEKIEAPDDPVTITPLPVDVPKPEKDPVYVLNAVMAGRRGTTAVIDGRPYREGARVRDSDWFVAAIDTAKRSATLRHYQSGRAMTITVELPLRDEP